MLQRIRQKLETYPRSGLWAIAGFVALTALYVFVLDNKSNPFTSKALVLLSGAAVGALFLRTVRFGASRLTSFLLFLFGFLFWSSVYLQFYSRETLLAEQLVYFHIVAGTLFFILFHAYLLQHVFETRKIPSPALRLTGILLTAGLSVSIWAGAFFSIVLHPSLRFMVAWHKWLFWLAFPVLIWHYLTAVKTDERLEGKGRVLNLIRKRRTILAVSLTLSAAVLPLMNAAVQKQVAPLSLRWPKYADALPAGYATPFGDGPFLPANATVARGRAIEDSPLLKRSRSCMGPGGYCHIDNHNEFEANAHRFSRNRFVRSTMNVLKEEKGTPALRYCAGCHDPLALLSGKADGPEYPPEDDGEGIGCVACHGMTPKSRGELGTAGYVFQIPSERFFRFSNFWLSNFQLTMAYLDDHTKDFKPPSLRDPSFCAVCHRHVVPEGINPSLTGLVVTDKLADWEASPFDSSDPAKRKVCVDCHMPKRFGEIDRVNAADHRFLGGNTGLPYVKKIKPYSVGEPKYAEPTMRGQLEETRNNLKNDKVRLEILSLTKAKDGISKLTLRLTNVGVGHKFPAGPPDLIEAWYEVVVTGADGASIHREGLLDEAHHLDPNAYTYAKTYLDGEGKVLYRHDFWNLASVKGRDEVPSGGSDEPVFSFGAPPGAKSPLHVRVRLRHRRFNQTFTDWAYGSPGTETMPVTDIASAEGTFPLE